jgi:hypothetical protein
MLRASLKSRLITAASLWIAIGMIGAGVTLSALFKYHVSEQFYNELYVHLDELQRLSEFHKDGQPAFAAAPQRPALRRSSFGLLLGDPKGW